MKGSSLKYLTREGFRNIWVNRLMTLASVTVLLACLVIIGVGAMAFFNIDALLDKVEAQNVVMVYVEMDSDDLTTSGVGVELQNMENIESCEFIPKEDAFRAQIESMGGDSAVFEGFTECPLPDAYKVTLKDLTQFSATVEQIKTLTGVSSVRENSDLASKLLSIRRAVTIVSIGLVVMLFLVALFIIANTIRITMFSRKLEINIMKAVGATNWFIRWPFLVEGVLIGIIASVISLGVLCGLYELASVSFSDLLMSFGFSMVPFSQYALQILGVFLGIGIFTGGFGSMISMNKYLKEQGSVVSNE
ncbi:MAG: permease-like cell division protein FtsX [Candidatus Fimenecus sp.]|nr:permease-like cell division protein FtsX [Clostridia bacterium]